MKYYVVSDVHGYYTELISELKLKGFFEDNTPHKLIICGDIFDRGEEAVKLQEFIIDLIRKDEVIIIRGNHEDLAIDFLEKGPYMMYGKLSLCASHYWKNGTVDTLSQLTKVKFPKMLYDMSKFVEKCKKTPYISEFIPAMVDYFETEHYVFVHGWIPCAEINMQDRKTYFYVEDWRNVSKQEWDNARWYNGMECGNQGVIEPNKTIVCGHWHCSYGHYHYGEAESEFEESAIFEPFYGKGYIAIDACTALTHKINCIVLED